MERTNYTPHLLDSIEQIRGQRNPLSDKRYGWSLHCLEKGLRQGVKFLLPENGAVVADQFTWEHRHLDLMYLPYEAVVLEYPCQKDSRHDNKDNMPESWQQVTLAFPIHDQDGDGAAVFSFAKLPSRGWVPWPVGAAVYREIYRADVADRETVKPLPLTDDPEVAAAEHMFVHELATDIAAVVNLCACLNCENVETDTIREPKSLNKKRKAKGKKPLFEYKVLRLTDDGQKWKQGSPIGRQSSPRVHLRRGHIRRLPGGRAIWVRPTVVGDKSQGVVSKDYQLQRY